MFRQTVTSERILLRVQVLSCLNNCLYHKGFMSIVAELYLDQRQWVILDARKNLRCSPPHFIYFKERINLCCLILPRFIYFSRGRNNSRCFDRLFSRGRSPLIRINFILINILIQYISVHDTPLLGITLRIVYKVDLAASILE